MGFRLLPSGFRAAAGGLLGYDGLRQDERPDELSSVLYQLVINCQDRTLIYSLLLTSNSSTCGVMHNRFMVRLNQLKKK